MQEKILNELLTQGLREDIAKMLSDMLEKDFQQEAMMKYLISIREETVSALEVVQVAQRLSELESSEEDTEYNFNVEERRYIKDLKLPFEVNKNMTDEQLFEVIEVIQELIRTKGIGDDGFENEIGRVGANILNKMAKEDEEYKEHDEVIIKETGERGFVVWIDDKNDSVLVEITEKNEMPKFYKKSEIKHI